MNKSKSKLANPNFFYLPTTRIMAIFYLLTAVVFVAHGMFAIGIYPVPARFVQMTIAILGFSEQATFNFLWIAGLLDFIVAIMLFIPRISRVAMLYMFFWGTLTALARSVSGFNADFWMESLHAYVYETVIRIPHGMIPLALYLLSRNRILV